MSSAKMAAFWSRGYELNLYVGKFDSVCGVISADISYALANK